MNCKMKSEDWQEIETELKKVFEGERGEKMNETKEREAFQAHLCKELADVIDILMQIEGLTDKQKKQFEMRRDVLRGMSQDFESEAKK